MAGKYLLDILSPTGVKLKTVTSFISMDLVRAENEVGALSLKFPYNSALRDYLVRDARIVVNRVLPSGFSYVEGDTQWFVTVPAHEVFSDRTISVSAHDNTGLLARRTIPYLTGSTQAELWDTASNCIKYIMRTNFGNLATDPARDASAFLTIDADDNLGPVVKISVAGMQVLDAIRQLSDASKENNVYLIYDIISDPINLNNFIFRIWKDARGVDHSISGTAPVTISQENGAFTNPEFVEDYSNEVNVVYAGGEGVGSGQVNTVEIDSERAIASPFARREVYIQPPNCDDIDKLQTAAQAALRKGRPKIFLTGKVSDTRNIQYGIHYKYGDTVTATYRGKSYNCHINAIHIQYENRQEVLDIYAKSESAI